VRGLVLALTLSSCALPKQTLCESHCWEFKNCLNTRVDIDSCAQECMEEIPESRLSRAYSYPNPHCEYVDWWSARYSFTTECSGDGSWTVVNDELFDCYAKQDSVKILTP
jgi:hypothetical protein